MKNKITIIDTIQEEMQSDDVNRLKQDLQMLKAYNSKDIDAFLITLCGWSFNTIVEINISNGGVMKSKKMQKLFNK
jgi:hypothetical protein